MSNKNIEKFSLSQRIKSFIYAFSGFKILFKEEHNARIHAVVAVAVIAVGFIFRISAIEWMVITLCIGFVIVCEIINSAIENVCDTITCEKNENIRKAKDLAAAAVLFAAIVSIVCGLIIFIPRILNI